MQVNPVTIKVFRAGVASLLGNSARARNGIELLGLARLGMRGHSELMGPSSTRQA
jgi:hypothetical protein